MLAWPAKGKLVKLAKAGFPPAASRTAVRCAKEGPPPGWDIRADRRFRISALAAQPHSRDLYPVRSRAFL
jgi:hypothetical protein